MAKIFDGKKTAKLGTEKNPAIVSVQTKKRMKEVATIFEKNGWKFTIGLEPDEPEDITDLEILLNPPKTIVGEKKIGRNDPCPCGSGKKYKKCCLGKEEPTWAVPERDAPALPPSVPPSTLAPRASPEEMSAGSVPECTSARAVARRCVMSLNELTRKPISSRVGVGSRVSKIRPVLPSRRPR